MKLSDKHLFFNVGQELTSLLAPLQESNISYFCYAKSYKDGSRFFLVNNTADLEAYLTNQHYLHGNCEAKPQLYQNQALLWSTLKQQHLYQFSRDNFDIDHGMTLINQQDDFCEFFAFASTHDHLETINLYLNHLDKFQLFTLSFKEKARDLIKKAEQNKIILPFHDHQIVKPTSFNFEDNTDYAMSSNYKSFRSKNINLSPQQLRMIPFIIEGRTAKEIARLIHLSPRTVEEYINSIKAKLHAKNKADLIGKLVRA